jgi:uncharacterized membrane protein YhaH (DUF805 family)
MMLALIRSFFSFSGRINRLQFLIRFACLCAAATIFFVNDHLTSASDGMPNALVYECLDIVVFFTLAWCFWVNSAKRWHDSNASGFYALINIVPVIGVPLNFLLNAVIPGSSGNNRFGALPSVHWRFWRTQQ